MANSDNNFKIWEIGDEIEPFDFNNDHMDSSVHELSTIASIGPSSTLNHDIDNIIINCRSRELSEEEYNKVIMFLDSNLSKYQVDKVLILKDILGEKLKEKYFKHLMKDYLDVYNYIINEDDIDKNLSNDRKDIRYITYEFFINHKELLESDMIPSKVRTNINKILNNEKLIQYFVDVDKRNQKSMENHMLYDKGYINQQLKNKILEGMTIHYSDLEKSMYIYIKMCKLLSYDFKYYVNDRYSLVHESFEHLKDIDLNNMNIVCFEFSAIYSELLNELGVKVNDKTSYVFSGNSDSFDTFDVDSHSSVEYSVDDIVIFADSTTSVLQGDLINAKMNKNLVGLQCRSLSEEKKKNFDQSLKKVYSDVIRQDDYNSALSAYEELANVKSNSIPFNKKVMMLFDKIHKLKVQPVDAISYINNLKHVMFSDIELRDNFKINFVGYVEDKKTYYPVTIFSINKGSFKGSPDYTIQYLFDSKKGSLSEVSSEDLKNLISSHNLFLMKDTGIIPQVNDNMRGSVGHGR